MRRLSILRRFFTTATNTNLAPVPTPPQFDAYAVKPDQYRDLNSKIKMSTGYAALEVEPFPRMKIMEIGRFCLENLKVGIPEDALCRIFFEEYIKNIMETTHNTPNILLLEQELGVDCIEMFIERFSRTMMIIDNIREDRLWEQQPIDPEDQMVYQMSRVPYDEFQRFEKTQTPVASPLLKNG